jgi:hypothetical protein
LVSGATDPNEIPFTFVDRRLDRIRESALVSVAESNHDPTHVVDASLQYLRVEGRWVSQESLEDVMLLACDCNRIHPVGRVATFSVEKNRRQVGPQSARIRDAYQFALHHHLDATVLEPPRLRGENPARLIVWALVHQDAAGQGQQFVVKRVEAI